MCNIEQALRGLKMAGYTELEMQEAYERMVEDVGNEEWTQEVQ